ncbi:SMI1/KNR4 family protein [Paenibacillus eucommiae]|uniref:Knr4/Smi1-like domain-containing protein n=1 Tax=Paenibacillus eucommiae TaxID=1355755 RepID=A0ABS4IUI4_9BACL|nr:SMI1/KNR4 family protein [Paenibacillus eucommiae]MBP1991232.1 hypothetical protein [Paenibacillus eucommiae]
MEDPIQSGTYRVDNCGKKVFSGTYYLSEVLNKDSVPQLYQNHGSSDEEIENMKKWLLILSRIVHGDDITYGCTEQQIDEAEERLGISLPKELRVFYHTVGNDERLTADGDVKKRDRYLTIDQIYMEEGNIVFRMRKKEPFALSLDKRQIMFLDDGNWFWEPCMESFCENTMIVASVFAISHMKNSAKGRLKGQLVSSLQARALAEQAFFPTFQALDTYYHPFCALFYHEQERRLGWFRSNGIMSDILIGTQTAADIEEFGEKHGNIKFKYANKHGER